MGKRGDEEFCVKCIMDGLEKRVWEKRVKNATPSAAILTPSATRTRGIGGAVRGQEEKIERESHLAQSGLADLNNLMSHAREMAQLARATSHKLDQKSEDAKLDEVAKLRGIMINLGIDNNLEEKGLESEIALVARPLMDRTGGMVLLEEVYCALNRARGSQLASPDEIYAAAKNIERHLPSAGLKYKKYASGIAVLQDNTLSDNAIVDQVR